LFYASYLSDPTIDHALQLATQAEQALLVTLSQFNNHNIGGQGNLLAKVGDWW
jgi:hypothetical protein